MALGGFGNVWVTLVVVVSRCIGWLWECMGHGSSQVSTDSCSESTVDMENPARKIKYAVFLNHRGPDTKKGFVDHLYAALQSAGVHSFVDCEALEVGEKSWDAIKSAIRHSKIHIAVFSPRYADSVWCLKELCEIFECSSAKSSEYYFLPVFYKVKPSDLCSPESAGGCYSSSFAKLRRTHDHAVIEKWKSALYKASMLTGFTLEDAANGFEARLVKRVTTKVLDVLNRTPLEVAEHPVGVEEQLKKALHLLQGRDNLQVKGGGVRTLGIIGMGGVGKTTLAMSIYNRIYRDFEGVTFMQSVRSEAKNLAGMQQRMLKDLLKTSISVDSTARGKEVMKERLQDLKIMIILDDVDEREQLEALLPSPDCRLKDGSLIVITTRDEQIVNLAHAHEKMFMQGLSDSDAPLLFNWHAFLKEQAPEELESLAKKVVAACQGLPLALKVLGAHLYNSDKSRWETTVSVLVEGRQRGFLVPAQSEVMKSLRISYDALGNNEKSMFLDIACSFLLGEHEDKAKRIWSKLPAVAELWLQNLKLKGLVGVDRYRRLTMHDLLRDMGREIVENGHQNKWQRSHLWNEDDVHCVLRSKNGTSEVRGLRLIERKSYGGPQPEWDTNSFAGMNALELLVLDGVKLTGDFARISKVLRWFQWRDCPLISLPSQICLENVAVLDLQRSIIESFSSHHVSQLRSLKELDLSICSKLKHLPEFNDCLSGLEKLNLCGCWNLESIPDSVCRLTLKELDLTYCLKLKHLPEFNDCLSGLETLKLWGCSNLESIPDSVCRLTLKELDLTYCSKLKHLPEFNDCLSGLEKLNLCGCSNLESIPDSVCRLTLKKLNLRGCSKLKHLPEFNDCLSGLETLNLWGCSNLESIPDSVCRLTLKDAQNSEKLNIDLLLASHTDGFRHG